MQNWEERQINKITRTRLLLKKINADCRDMRQTLHDGNFMFDPMRSCWENYSDAWLDLFIQRREVSLSLQCLEIQRQERNFADKIFLMKLEILNRIFRVLSEC